MSVCPLMTQSGHRRDFVSIIRDHGISFTVSWVAPAHSQSETAPPSVHVVVLENRTLFNILGIVLILLGGAAIALSSIPPHNNSELVLGWLFLIGGIVQIVHAFPTRQWRGFPLDLIIGVLYLLAGGWVATWSHYGLMRGYTAFAVMFIIQGLLEAGMAFRVHPHAGWVWMLLAGIVALAVSVFFLWREPLSYVDILYAVFVAIPLIMSGIAYLLVPLPARERHK